MARHGSPFSAAFCYFPPTRVISYFVIGAVIGALTGVPIGPVNVAVIESAYRHRLKRAIVLCEEAPESLSYAAAAVSDTVTFKTYRLALVFEDLEL